MGALRRMTPADYVAEGVVVGDPIETINYDGVTSWEGAKLQARELQRLWLYADWATEVFHDCPRCQECGDEEGVCGCAL